MVRVNWSLAAVEDLKNIKDYISKDSKQYAKIQIRRIKWVKIKSWGLSKILALLNKKIVLSYASKRYLKEPGQKNKRHGVPTIIRGFPKGEISVMAREV